MLTYNTIENDFGNCQRIRRDTMEQKSTNRFLEKSAITGCVSPLGRAQRILGSPDNREEVLHTVDHVIGLDFLPAVCEPVPIARINRADPEFPARRNVAPQAVADKEHIFRPGSRGIEGCKERAGRRLFYFHEIERDRPVEV